MYVYYLEIKHMLILMFFFKHKTAYEMRISDWSSDVCASDLRPLRPHPLVHVLGREVGEVRPAPEQGRDIAALARAAQRLGDIVADAGEAIEIAVADRLRLAPVSAQPSGTADIGYAVEATAVYRILLPGGLAVDLAQPL